MTAAGGEVAAGPTYAQWIARASAGSADVELGGAGEPPRTVARDGRTLVLDGALANSLELTRELGAPPGAGDAEIVLLGWERWGREVVHRLRGSWTLVVADAASGEIVGTRDHYGIHALFWAEVDGAALFSPSVAALAADGRTPRALNRAALADHLCHRWPVLDETYYEAIRRVPPGHWLTVRPGGHSVERYWNPSTDPRAPLPDEEEQALFDELLDGAVARCLVGPPAIYLSGGLDSVSIAAFAKQRAPELGLPDPYALSLVFEHETANEEEVQVQVARRLGLEQTIVPISRTLPEEGLIATAMTMSAERPAPMLNLWNPAYRWLALDGIAHGREVILTGNGGDEWLEYPIGNAAALIRRGDVVGLWRAYQSMQRSYPLSKARIARNVLWTYGSKPLLRGAGRRVLRPLAPPFFRAKRRRHVDRQTLGWVAVDPALRRSLYERFERMLDEERSPLDVAVVAIELEELFESGRRLGMRLLHPLWDVDLTAFIARTRPEAMIRGGRSKALVRRSLARRFPGLGFERHRKVTATSFYRSIVLDEGRRAWRSLGGARALAELGVVDEGAAGRYMERLLAGDDPLNQYRIWHVLSVEAWVRARL